ncbi:MAG: glycoside hydrolase family 140 protein [Sedimentisphaerales bacterium]|nr:glycoside hydrolase family 140 protein [Sedimentisphaerales bacterium]
MNRQILFLLLSLSFLCTASGRCRAETVCDPLQVSSNGRFLVHGGGTPFFWMGDTAWQLIHDLTRQEIEFYMANRAWKGFTVIQTVVLAELRGLEEPNRQGHFALKDKDPTKPIVEEGPDNDYWDDVEFVLKTARENGLYVGLLPTWGRYVTSNWQNGLVDGIFNESNALEYGQFVGKRFREYDNIIWIIGGDRAAPTDASRAIWRALARGITIGAAGKEDYSKTLMTYHTSGPGASWWFFNDEKWLDIRACQSGHGRSSFNWQFIQIGYSIKPIKPVLDLETAYPGFRHGRPPTIATDDHARRGAYWSVFAGACGHTYGHHSIWQMYDPIRPGVADPKQYWYEVLDIPSAFQMGYLRNLMESRPFITATPDQSMIVTEQNHVDDYIEALRSDGFIMVYTPTGKTFTLRMGKLRCKALIAWWFDPRKGEETKIGIVENKGVQSFDPPGSEGFPNDQVLVLDDPEKKFGPPGEVERENDAK